MYNLPSYDVKNFSVGPGILYVGPIGSTPTIDVGITRAGAVMTVERDKEKVMAGSPQHMIDAIAVSETAQLEVTGIEWNLSNLSRVLGAGITSHTGALENLALGGELSFDKVAVMYRHVTKAGHTIFVKLWEATGSGRMVINFNERLHEFPYTFECHDATTDWAGDSLDQDRRLFEIERRKQ